VNGSRKEKNFIIFSDAATSSKAMVSVGAFLCLDQMQFEHYSKYTAEILSTKVADAVVYKEYNSKKSTWSEIKTVIDALYTIHDKLEFDQKIEIYTDCQSLCDLINKRKEKLEKNNFMTRAGKVHQNADLYKELFAIADKFYINTIKIKGHDSYMLRLTVQEKIFAVLDKLTRKKLRTIVNDGARISPKSEIFSKTIR
jgi:ribonuclease HI